MWWPTCHEGWSVKPILQVSTAILADVFTTAVHRLESRSKLVVRRPSRAKVDSGTTAHRWSRDERRPSLTRSIADRLAVTVYLVRIEGRQRQRLPGNQLVTFNLRPCIPSMRERPSTIVGLVDTSETEDDKDVCVTSQNVVDGRWSGNQSRFSDENHRYQAASIEDRRCRSRPAQLEGQSARRIKAYRITDEVIYGRWPGSGHDRDHHAGCRDMDPKASKADVFNVECRWL